MAERSVKYTVVLTPLGRFSPADGNDGLGNSSSSNRSAAGGVIGSDGNKSLRSKAVSSRVGNTQAEQGHDASIPIFRYGNNNVSWS